MKRFFVISLAILISLLFCLPLSADFIGEHSGETWVDGPADTQPGSDPNNPDAAVDASGRSIFVWDGTPGATRKEIFLRIFPGSGGDPEDPIQVNTFVENAQHTPRVAVSGDGSFLVIWLSAEPPEPEDNFVRDVIRSQAFNANLDTPSDEQLISELDPTLTTANKADVAALRDGGYIVVWRSSQTVDQEPGHNNGTTIQGRMIAANGEPLGGQFQVNSTISTASESWPAVTELAGGGFLVVWTTPEVHGRRFAEDGTPIGDDFQINTFTTGGESETDIVVNQDGRVLVVWRDDEESGDDREIRGRLFSQDLAALGEDFRINTLTTGVQIYPRVADYGPGGFFVVWESEVSAGNDNDPWAIEGRIVTGHDQFAGPEFQVNDWIDGDQQRPGIGGKNGRIAVGWHSKSNPDTSNNVINGQFWSICGIFCDSFE